MSFLWLEAYKNFSIREILKRLASGISSDTLLATIPIDASFPLYHPALGVIGEGDYHSRPLQGSPHVGRWLRVRSSHDNPENLCIRDIQVSRLGCGSVSFHSLRYTRFEVRYTDVAVFLNQNPGIIFPLENQMTRKLLTSNLH